jgi:hypothetical protein
VPLLNPHWLACIPQVCLLPVADRPWALAQMTPLIVTLTASFFIYIAKWFGYYFSLIIMNIILICNIYNINLIIIYLLLNNFNIFRPLSPFYNIIWPLQHHHLKMATPQLNQHILHIFGHICPQVGALRSGDIYPIHRIYLSQSSRQLRPPSSFEPMVL